MEGSADLEVFSAVWIPCSEFPDQPCRHNVANVETVAGFSEASAAG